MNPESSATLGQRRLAAIVFTDVAGYSARMQRDETGTLELVRADFDRMRAHSERQGGEVLKSTGDGLLMSFGSVVQAVACTLQIQEEFGARPAEALQHRIGIHLGDVFREGGDVVGDGVNIAARLQTKARPGTICVSESVYGAVKGKLPLQATSLGPQAFKNIAEPITVYLLAPDGAKLAASSRSRGRKLVPAVLGFGAIILALLVIFRPKPAPVSPADPKPPVVPAPASVDENSIAVLPFTNMSDDKDNAWFADGIHEDLLTHLALIGELKVTSRTSVEEYRGTTKNMRQIGSELRVTNLLEGSVRRVGNKVRVTAQLIRAATDQHLWAKTYDRDLSDVFAIQAELAAEIAQSLRTTLSPQVRSELARIPTQNMAAYELLLRQQAINNRDGTQRPDVEQMIDLLQQAVKLDAGLAIAWARLGTMHARQIFDFRDVSSERLARAQAAIDRALELAPNAPEVRQELGNFYYYALRDYARAEAIFREMLDRSPHNVEVLAQMGYVLRREGRFRESNEYLEKVLALDPRESRALANMFFNYIRIRDFSGAQQIAGRLVALNPKDLTWQMLRQHATWRKTGRFDAYDDWRSAQVPGVETKVRSIALMDFRRALARRDFAAAERLLPSLPNSEMRALIWEALFWRAKGDAAAARRAAESGVAASQAALRQYPDNPKELAQLALLQAMLGERDAAWSGYARASQLIPASRDAFEGTNIATFRPQIHAVLGEREQAFKELQRTLRSFSYDSAAVAAVDLAFAAWWDEPDFKAIIADPANDALLQ